MVGVAISYAAAYRKRMHTISPDFLPFHRTAVVAAVDIVDVIRPVDLHRPTPCDRWTLTDLLAHMTAQHRGFAAAARGYGNVAEVWRTDTVVEAVAADPAGTYRAAAYDLLDAFAADGAENVEFALPDFGPDVKVGGVMAMGFHFVDYVVHGWDVAAALGMPYKLPDDVIAAVLPLVLAVPDGEHRLAPDSPFTRALEPIGADDFERILRHLGRRPDWGRLPSAATGA